MRFTDEQVRQALQHADKDVRFAALRYFAKSYSNNTAIMPDVIELLERLGPQEAFLYLFPIAELAQTPQTIAWAVRQLQIPASTEAQVNFQDRLGRLLCNADPQLVLPHQPVILESPGLDRQLATWLELRLGLVSTPSNQLWQRLEAICEAGKAKINRNQIAYDEAEALAEALARDGSQSERMMSLLKQDFDPDSQTALTWLEIFLVRIAGDMKHEPAVPLIINKLLIDGELLNQECGRALVKIGTDAVVRAVRDVYPQAPNHFRLFSCDVFGDIHSDLAVSAGIELISLELDLDLRVWLATALVDQFSTEAIDAARNVLLDDHPDSYDLKSTLVVACKLMSYDVPELKQWERDLTESSRRLVRRNSPSLAFSGLEDEPIVAPISTSMKTGRNGPCPCGSGKKFKNCCLSKRKT